MTYKYLNDIYDVFSSVSRDLDSIWGEIGASMTGSPCALILEPERPQSYVIADELADFIEGFEGDVFKIPYDGEDSFVAPGNSVMRYANEVPGEARFDNSLSYDEALDSEVFRSSSEITVGGYRSKLDALVDDLDSRYNCVVTVDPELTFG